MYLKESTWREAKSERRHFRSNLKSFIMVASSFSSFFLSESSIGQEMAYKRSFFSFLSFYAKKTSHGWGAKEAWNAAWKWGVDPLSLNESELRQLWDLISILSDNQKVNVTYFDGGKKEAIIYWNRNEKYPTVS